MNAEYWWNKIDFKKERANNVMLTSQQLGGVFGVPQYQLITHWAALPLIRGSRKITSQFDTLTTPALINLCRSSTGHTMFYGERGVNVSN